MPPKRKSETAAGEGQAAKRRGGAAGGGAKASEREKSAPAAAVASARSFVDKEVSPTGSSHDVTTSSPIPSSSSRQPSSRWKTLSEKLRSRLRAAKQRVTLTPTLGLFRVEPRKDGWFAVTRGEWSLEVCTPEMSKDDLLGFDNTGNVRMWPGGEALAAHLMEREDWGRVLELGCGMLGLPGLVASERGSVTITDGNDKGVENVRRIAEANAAEATCEKYVWGEEREWEGFDTVLCADCVFLEQAHGVLLDSLDKLLADGGQALICSPERKGSLQRFLERVRQDGRFAASREEMRVLEKVDKEAVDVDLDWPVLYVLQRK